MPWIKVLTATLSSWWLWSCEREAASEVAFIDDQDRSTSFTGRLGHPLKSL